MKKIIVIACLLFPSLAFAQYYSPPPSGSVFPGGFHNRTGRLMFGFSLGAGTMSSRGNTLDCRDCDYSTLAGELTGHIGGFLGPRFALMGEAQVDVQTLGSSFSPEMSLQLLQLMSPMSSCMPPRPTLPPNASRPMRLWKPPGSAVAGCWP